jgi:hypothetical protein
MPRRTLELVTDAEVAMVQLLFMELLVYIGVMTTGQVLLTQQTKLVVVDVVHHLQQIQI